MSILKDLFSGFPHTVQEVFLGLAPIVVIFIILQIMSLRVGKREFRRIIVGFVITYVGLVFFMQGVQVAFKPVGTYFGNTIGVSPYRWILIPIGFVMGFLTAFAEPSVRVMVKQVEELSTGTIKAKLMLNVISVGVAVAVAIAMVRLLAGFSIWWYLIPGYALVLILSRCVDPVFVGIAFDNGGVATGPMCSTFILAFSIGIAEVMEGRSKLLDGFGIVALIAMAPILTTLILGLVFKAKRRRTEKRMNEMEQQDEGEEKKLDTVSE